MGCKMIKDILRYSDQMPLFYKYLKGKGYSAQLLYRYTKSGWLEKLSKGVYKKQGQALSPVLVVKALQEQLQLEIFIGAQTAMALQNKSHYVKFDQKYQLFVYSQARLNGWIKSLPYFQFNKITLFTAPLTGLTELEGVRISSLERAFIEMAELVPDNAAYDELINNLELVPNLRTELLQTLLEGCLSIKAKRLFLHAADKVQHKWFARLNLGKVSLGKGPRQLVKKGVYDKKYNIYVPKVD